jgi:P22 coat protein - gene protein 5
MPNTLTNLVPDLYEAVDVVSREMVGMIPSVSLLASAERAAQNEVIRVPITPAASAEDSTPGQLPPDDGDQTIGNTPVTISKSRVVPFRWTGDEQKGVNNQQPNGGYKTIRQQQIQQALRTLVNEIEAFTAGVAYLGASRAFGTAGTTPFATDLSAPAQLRKILADNGAPMGDLKMVIDTTAGANMRSLAQLTKANEAGTDDTLRRGTLLDLDGFQIRESAGIAHHVAGTGAGYLANGAQAVGATGITADTGTGTILAGDFVTAAGDANKYVVGSPLAAGAFSLNAPGLRAALADNTALTVGGNYTANLGFARSAIVLLTRQIAIPEEGDMADDAISIVDPLSGIVFEFRMYKQYKRVRYEVGLAYGAANIKPEHTAILLG